MITDEFLKQLQGVRPRGHGRWSARCPAHEDRSPSLSVREMEGKLLVFCFSGCSLHRICRALAITVSDLFYDALPSNLEQRKAAVQQRNAIRRKSEYEARKLGRLLDACREAEWFINSRQGLDISTWSNDRLDRELNLLADAHRVLEADPYAAH